MSDTDHEVVRHLSEAASPFTFGAADPDADDWAAVCREHLELMERLISAIEDWVNE